MSYKRINRNDFQITLTDKYTSENFKEDMKSIFDSFEIPKNKEIQINIIGKSEVCHRILDNTDINIRWRRKSKELRKFGDINELEIDLELIDSFFQSAPVDARPLWFLGKSLELLSTADCVYFAPGWENYRGCKIEHLCAEQYGIKIIE